MRVLRPIWIIAVNTFREIMRDRILYGILVFAVLLMGFSMALGNLSFGEQKRISADFGFTAIHICSVALSIFVGSTLVSKEIDKKTILTLLARPISRLDFLLGKSLGLVLVLSVVMSLLTLVLLGLFLNLGMNLKISFFVGLWGIVVESLIHLSLAIMFSCFVRPILVVSYCLGIFLVGHWINDLVYFANKSSDPAFKFFGTKVAPFLPNFEYYNWRSLYVYDETFPLSHISKATANGFFWVVLFLIISSTLIRKRDFA